MKYKSIILIIIIISSMTLFLFGCKTQESSILQNKTIYISSAATSIGADENEGVLNTDIQVLSYEFSLYNETDNKVFINNIEPIFETEFAKKVITKDIKVTVQKDLLPKSTITVEGKVKFDSIGMSKEQIVALEPYITDIKINYDQVVGFAKKVNISKNSASKSISNNSFITHSPTPQEVLDQSPDADIFMLNNTVAQNAKDIEWVQNLKLTKEKEVGQIKSQYKQGNISVLKDGIVFENGMATKLPIGTKIYSVKERSEILLIEKDGQQLRYLMLLEG